MSTNSRCSWNSAFNARDWCIRYTYIGSNIAKSASLRHTTAILRVGLACIILVSDPDSSLIPRNRFFDEAWLLHQPQYSRTTRSSSHLYRSIFPNTNRLRSNARDASRHWPVSSHGYGVNRWVTVPNLAHTNPKMCLDSTRHGTSEIRAWLEEETVI